VILIAQENCIWSAIDFGRTARCETWTVVNGKLRRKRVPVENAHCALDTVSIARRRSPFSPASPLSSALIPSARVAPRAVNGSLGLKLLWKLNWQRILTLCVPAVALMSSRPPTKANRKAVG
jgi:hypothetical protein